MLQIGPAEPGLGSLQDGGTRRSNRLQDHPPATIPEFTDEILDGDHIHQQVPPRGVKRGRGRSRKDPVPNANLSRIYVGPRGRKRSDVQVVDGEDDVNYNDASFDDGEELLDIDLSADNELAYEDDEFGHMSGLEELNEEEAVRDEDAVNDGEKLLNHNKEDNANQASTTPNRNPVETPSLSDNSAMEKYFPPSEFLDEWNATHEGELRSWRTRAIEVRRVNIGNQLRKLFLRKTMIHLFDATPDDLFTWGYRQPSANSVSYALATAQFIIMLSEIVPHPIWDHNINHLRYILQCAAASRVDGRVDPIAPPDEAVVREMEQLRTELVAGGIAVPQAREITRATAWNLYLMTDKRKPVVIARLAEIPRQRIDNKPLGDDGRRSYFYVHEDLIDIKTCLDGMVMKEPGNIEALLDRSNFGYFPHTTAEYEAIYRQETNQPNMTHSELTSLWIRTMTRSELDALYKFEKLARERKEKRRIMRRPDVPYSDLLRYQGFQHWEDAILSKDAVKILWPAGQPRT
ncbi:Uu.00g026110.m01.CDS01 [Anthostomella pinea]|uniref:Uu.00g026110.m01.CDS01 n=1 Tax=Anthostomella pinea TaxID=933095 RepID=A0AAI8YCP7_9PEZI|nr:Uu.00g026110.m01.CDS01 [Anthostomella pinea]